MAARAQDFLNKGINIYEADFYTFSKIYFKT